jgi:hypothetical protein
MKKRTRNLTATFTRKGFKVISNISTFYMIIYLIHNTTRVSLRVFHRAQQMRSNPGVNYMIPNSLKDEFPSLRSLSEPFEGLLTMIYSQTRQ